MENIGSGIGAQTIRVCNQLGYVDYGEQRDFRRDAVLEI